MRVQAAVVVALLLFACAGGEPAPPNLVLVIGDDHGYPDFGFMGSPVVQTPRLDRLAAEGVVFPVGYSTASLCRPALRTLLTGLEPSQYARMEYAARRSPDADAASTPLIREIQTLPRLLAERGYKSFQAGKYSEGHYRSAGFSEGMVEHPGNRGLRSSSRLVRESLDPVLEFVSENAERPFFLWFAPKLPHLPHDPPARHVALYAEADVWSGARDYYAMISWFDEAVGQLVDHIDGLALGRRTLIVYLADNGWDARPSADEEHSLLGGPQGKKTLYELGFRTPIVLRWLGELPGGVVRDELVSAVDLFPTLLDYAGVATPPDRPGHSLRPLLEGRGPWPRAELIGSSHVVRTDEPRLAMGGFFWRDARWHYLEPAQRSVELYDLDVDPGESRNVAKLHPEVVARARAAIREWSASLPKVGQDKEFGQGKEVGREDER